jgi:hypothetical protein
MRLPLPLEKFYRGSIPTGIQPWHISLLHLSGTLTWHTYLAQSWHIYLAESEPMHGDRALSLITSCSYIRRYR